MSQSLMHCVLLFIFQKFLWTLPPYEMLIPLSYVVAVCPSFSCLSFHPLRYGTSSRIERRLLLPCWPIPFDSPMRS